MITQDAMEEGIHGGTPMWRVWVLSILVATVAGCGITAKVNARDDMEISKAAYKNCLAQNAQNVTACDAARLSYEADVKAYRATSAGIQPGRNDTINVNTSSEP